MVLMVGSVAFPVECTSDRILKIGQYYVMYRMPCTLFFLSQCIT